MKRDHRPQRTCLGCGARDEQGRMLRLVVRETGELQVDRLGRGRGGYLHDTEACREAFCRRKSVHRAFRVEVSRLTREKFAQSLRLK
ncbi:MAG: YlxR family protein [Candidatus Binatia bacterium]